MATSSFTKTFVLDSEASKKLEKIQEKVGYSAPILKTDPLEEGREALKRFSPPSKT